MLGRGRPRNGTTNGTILQKTTSQAPPQSIPKKASSTNASPASARHGPQRSGNPSKKAASQTAPKKAALQAVHLSPISVQPEVDSEDDFDMSSSQPYPPSQKSSSKGSSKGSESSKPPSNSRSNIERLKNNMIPSDESSQEGEPSGYVMRSPPSTGRKQRRMSIESDSEESSDNDIFYEPPVKQKKPLVPHVKKVIKTNSSKTPSKSRPGSARKLVPDKNQPCLTKFLTPKKEVDPVVRHIDFDHDYATPGQSREQQQEKAMLNDSVVEMPASRKVISLIDLTDDDPQDDIDDSASTVVYPMQDSVVDNVTDDENFVTPPSGAPEQRDSDLTKTVGYGSQNMEASSDGRAGRQRRDGAETILYNIEVQNVSSPASGATAQLDNDSTKTVGYGSRNVEASTSDRRPPRPRRDSDETILYNSADITESHETIAADSRSRIVVNPVVPHAEDSSINAPTELRGQNEEHGRTESQAQPKPVDSVSNKRLQGQKDIRASPVIMNQETIKHQRKVIARAVLRVKSENQGTETEGNSAPRVRERTPSSDSVRVTSTSNIEQSAVTSQPGPTLVNLKLEVEVDPPSSQVSGAEDVSAPSETSAGTRTIYCYGTLSYICILIK